MQKKRIAGLVVLGASLAIAAASAASLLRGIAPLGGMLGALAVTGFGLSGLILRWSLTYRGDTPLGKDDEASSL